MAYPPQPPYPPPFQTNYVLKPPTSGLSTASMVCGILGFFTCGLASLLAVIFGHIGISQTADNRMSGRGQAVAGLVLGYVVLIPAIIWMFFMLIGMAAVPFVATTGQP